MNRQRLGGGATNPLPPMADPTGSSDAATTSAHLNCINGSHESYNWNETLPDFDAEHLFYCNAEQSYPQPDGFFEVGGNVARVDSYTSNAPQQPPHDGYVFLGDIELDNTFSVPTIDAQPLQSLFDDEGGMGVQDENGLTNLWSPHGVPADPDPDVNYTHVELPDLVPLMQDAEFSHAEPSQQSEDPLLQIPTSQRSPYPNASASIECQSLREIVRRWLSDHASRPYPSRKEKKKLANSAGCSVKQLNIRFRNIRAREKHLFDGHANVRNGRVTTNTGLHANMAAQSSCAQPGRIAFADDTSPYGFTSPTVTNTSDNSSWPSPSDSGYPTPENNQDIETQVHQHPAAESACQVTPSVSGLQEATMPNRKGRRFHAPRHQYGTSEHLPVAPQQTSSTPSFQEPENRFPCTVCVKACKNATEWKRHEASVHGYNDREWVCMLTDAFKLQSECVFCLEPMDSIDHVDKHAIDPCSHKCTAERSFPRKDLLKQHILLAHLADAPPSIKKRFEVPKEWSRELEIAPGGPGSRWCGFCGCMLETTAKRMDHVAQHFRDGQNMTSWVHM